MPALRLQKWLVRLFSVDQKQHENIRLPEKVKSQQFQVETIFLQSASYYLSATLSYRCLYLGFIQCDIVNLHFRDFSFEICRILAIFKPHSNCVGVGCYLIIFANVLWDTEMSVDIQRVISSNVIVTCCNMNPLSCWKNLSSYNTNQCLGRSFDDLIEEFAVHNPHTDSPISVAE